MSNRYKLLINSSIMKKLIFRKKMKKIVSMSMNHMNQAVPIHLRQIVNYEYLKMSTKISEKLVFIESSHIRSTLYTVYYLEDFFI